MRNRRWGAQRGKGGSARGVQQDVLAFHQTFALHIQETPSLCDISDSLIQLRADLLEEEVGEFVDAARSRDIVGLADALADIVYVAYGSAITFGIDLDAVVREVHRSNMTKLGPNGEVLRRSDGKVIKSELYTPPDVVGVLNSSRSRNGG
jgi:predicted HAD superfamily Cof-like phosphohydrolase